MTDIPTNTTDVVAVDAEQLRTWLTSRLAGLDHGTHLNSAAPTVAEFLAHAEHDLRADTEQTAWTLRYPLTGIGIYPTGHDDGVDGGAIITADITIGTATTRLATPHQNATALGGDSVRDVDDAVRALTGLADTVNQLVTGYQRAAADALTDLLNRITDDILDVTEAGDTGVRDALNLVVNSASVYYLASQLPDSERERLDLVAGEQYGEDLDTIVGWINN